MRRLLVPSLILIAASAFGQLASPDSSHPFVADFVAGVSDLRGGGQWRSADLIVTHASAGTTGYLFLHRISRPEGSGGFIGIAATHDWTSRFFTYIAAGAAAPRASYLPNTRFDLDLNFKFGPQQRIVATAGAMKADYAEHRRDDLLSAGLTYYAPLIITYRFFRNTSAPGAVRSHAQLVQIAVERPGNLSAYLRQSWGIEAYQLTTIVTPQNVRVSGQTTTASVRKWMMKRGGIVGELERQTKGSDFRRVGARIGGFYTF